MKQRSTVTDYRPLSLTFFTLCVWRKFTLILVVRISFLKESSLTSQLNDLIKAYLHLRAMLPLNLTLVWTLKNH